MTARSLRDYLLVCALALAVVPASAPAATPAVPPVSPAAQGHVLRVCLDDNSPLNSLKRGKTQSGFDLAVAAAVAERLHRPFAVQWFENEQDEDAVLSHQVNALLSAGLCDLVGGYALTADGLGASDAKTARLPDYDGGSRADRTRNVALGELVPSHPYRLAPLTVVLGPDVPARPIAKLGDLADLTLGSEDGTLSGTILMLYGGGRLVPRITHVVPHRDVLDRLEHGEYQATLIELSRLDAYRLQHPDSRLQPSGYYHSIAFNIGFVGLAVHAGLLREVDQAVDDLLAAGKIGALAEREHLTYVAPARPLVRDKIPITAYFGD